MSARNLEELGQAFIELGQLLQEKSSTVSQLASAAEKCGIRLGLALLPLPDPGQQAEKEAEQ